MVGKISADHKIQVEGWFIYIIASYRHWIQCPCSLIQVYVCVLYDDNFGLSVVLWEFGKENVIKCVFSHKIQLSIHSIYDFEIRLISQPVILGFLKQVI